MASVEERLALIKEVGEEIINEEELRGLLKSKAKFRAYDGFEPSGNMHIAQALLRALNVNRMTKAGARFLMFIADWHAWANGKLGGDLDRIQTTGKYFIEVWKASGMDLSQVEFIWASDLVKDEAYWRKVMEIATTTTVKRVLRCTQIMGRSEKETLHASQILYPCMQAADIFHLKADVVQLGMDQRKVNVLARELAEKVGGKKPIIVSHHMLLGLGEPPKGEDTAERAIAMKMSKSKPDNAIFVTDTEEEVVRKLTKAYCPEAQAKENPVLEYCRYIVFPLCTKLDLKRQVKYGGDRSFRSYQELERAFVAKEVHPADLKRAAAAAINHLLEPIRTHFSQDAKAAALFKQVQSFAVTR